jgi:hypothetical protein
MHTDECVRRNASQGEKTAACYPLSAFTSSGSAPGPSLARPKGVFSGEPTPSVIDGAGFIGSKDLPLITLKQLVRKEA